MTPPDEASKIIRAITNQHAKHFTYLCGIPLNEGHVYLLRDRRSALVYGVTSFAEFRELAKRGPQLFHHVDATGIVTHHTKPGPAGS